MVNCKAVTGLTGTKGAIGTIVSGFVILLSDFIKFQLRYTPATCLPFSPNSNKIFPAMATPVVIAATAKHTGTLIFLHGLGDTGQGWASAMGAIRPPHVKVICPTAPTMPVTLNAGFRMPSWFDLKSLDESSPEDESGIKGAAKQIHSMIDGEVSAGIPAEKIVLGGFSQGGALALYSALTYPKKLACVVSLSCWLPLYKSFPASKKTSDNLPILLCHGDCDPIVPYKWGQMSASVLKTMFKDVDFRSYRGLTHGSCDQELSDIREFIAKHL